MARRLGEPTALVDALMGRHAALLHAEHAAERRRVGEEMLAVAGELEDAELGALARHWLLYDLAELGELARRADATASSSASRPNYNSRSTGTRRWPGAASGRASRDGSTRPSGWPATRCASPKRAGAPDAQTHFTAQLVAIRREQGRLDELLPEIERLAGGDA